MTRFSLFVCALGVAGAITLNNPCLDSTQPYAKQPWCNATLPIATRVADMVSRMDLKTEKIPK